MTTLLFLLQIYLVIGLSTWGIIVLLLYSKGLVVQVTPESIIGWTMIVVGWPFAVGWFVHQMLYAFSDAIDQIHGGGDTTEEDDDNDDDDDDDDQDGSCLPSPARYLGRSPSAVS